MIQGWKIKKLGDIATVSSGNSAPQKKELFENGNFPFIRTSDVGKIKKGFISSCVDYLNEDGIKGLKLFKKGTILFPKSGASTFLNHRVLMEIDSYVSSHLATIKAVNSMADERYLLHYLTTIDARDLMQDIAYPSLKISDINLIKIPLPSLPEQQLIVAILDGAFAAIAKAKANAEQNLTNAKELFESYLQGVFENKSEGWEEKKLGDVVDFFNGFAFKSKDAIETSNTQLIRMGNLYQNQLNLDRRAVFYPDNFAVTYKKYLLEENDLIISLTGTTDKEDYGYTVRIPENEYNLLLNQRIAKISIKNEKATNKDYLFHFLLSRTFLDKLYKTANGTRQANLSTETMKGLSIAIPNIKQQQIIVQKLDALSAETKKLEAIYQQKIKDLEELKKSILQKAFAGELKTEKAVAV